MDIVQNQACWVADQPEICVSLSLVLQVSLCQFLGQGAPPVHCQCLSVSLTSCARRGSWDSLSPSPSISDSASPRTAAGTPPRGGLAPLRVLLLAAPAEHTPRTVRPIFGLQTAIMGPLNPHARPWTPPGYPAPVQAQGLPAEGDVAATAAEQQHEAEQGTFDLHELPMEVSMHGSGRT